MGSHAAGVHGGQGGEHSSHLERALGSANKVIHRALEGMCIKSPSGDVSDGDEIIMDPSSSDPEDALRRRLADQQRQSATPPPADSFPHDPAAKQGGSDGVYNLLEAMTCGRDELKQLASEAKAELKQPRRIHSEGAVRPIGGPVSIDEDSIQRKEAVADLARVLVEMRGAWVPSHRRELERLAEPPTLTRSCYMSHILTSMRLIDVQVRGNCHHLYLCINVRAISVSVSETAPWEFTTSLLITADDYRCLMLHLPPHTPTQPTPPKKQHQYAICTRSAVILLSFPPPLQGSHLLLTVAWTETCRKSRMMGAVFLGLCHTRMGSRRIGPGWCAWLSLRSWAAAATMTSCWWR